MREVGLEDGAARPRGLRHRFVRAEDEEPAADRRGQAHLAPVREAQAFAVKEGEAPVGPDARRPTSTGEGQDGALASAPQTPTACVFLGAGDAWVNSVAFVERADRQRAAPAPAAQCGAAAAGTSLAHMPDVPLVQKAFVSGTS